MRYVLRRVTGQPSSKTSYVVLGEDAGPSKLAAIKKNGLKSINEDEFLNLIATRSGPLEDDEKTRKKKEKERKEMEQTVKEMEAREKAALKASKGKAPEGAAKVVGYVGLVKASPERCLLILRVQSQ